ncbi:MAG: integrase core domain-containing protein, partial [Pyrinomonadaceae bacterium]
SIRQKVPLSLDDAKRIVGEYVEEYNTKRLHSAIGWVTPEAKLMGKSAEIWAIREARLAKARAKRVEKSGLRNAFESGIADETKANSVVRGDKNLIKT